MRYLLATCGTGGDQVPYIAIGKHLADQGHDVTLIGNGAYRHLADRVNLPFVSIISPEEDARRNQLRQSSGRNAGRSGIPNLIADIEPVYRELAHRIRPGQTVVLANIMAMGARLAQEKYDVPTVTLPPSPIVFYSPHDPACWPPRMPGFLRGIMAHVVNRGMDRCFRPALNEFRKKVGLPPQSQPVRPWMFSPDLVLNMLPEWFLPPQPDWPPNVHSIGFMMPAVADTAPLPDVLEEFLAGGAPPLVFSYTSGISAAESFYRQGIEAAAQLGERAVILAPDSVALPATLPRGMLRLPSAAHRRLFPRAKLAVHHGGVGSAAAACAAGVPQFIVPAMYDQPEVMRRLTRLGVADGLAPKKFTAAAAVPKLRALMESASVHSRCREIADRMQRENGLDRLTELLHEFQHGRLKASA